MDFTLSDDQVAIQDTAFRPVDLPDGRLGEPGAHGLTLGALIADRLPI